jgi:hypothetical protein
MGEDAVISSGRMTIFCDIDGVLFEQTNYISTNPRVLSDVLEKLWEWSGKDYTIVLTTGRKESTRSITESTLQESGICYDHLLMGLGCGDRILINDRSSTGRDKAFAINLDRNTGLKGVEI